MGDKTEQEIGTMKVRWVDDCGLQRQTELSRPAKGKEILAAMRTVDADILTVTVDLDDDGYSYHNHFDEASQYDSPILKLAADHGLALQFTPHFALTSRPLSRPHMGSLSDLLAGIIIGIFVPLLGPVWLLTFEQTRNNVNSRFGGIIGTSVAMTIAGLVIVIVGRQHDEAIAGWIVLSYGVLLLASAIYFHPLRSRVGGRATVVEYSVV